MVLIPHYVRVKSPNKFSGALSFNSYPPNYLPDKDHLNWESSDYVTSFTSERQWLRHFAELKLKTT